MKKTLTKYLVGNKQIRVYLLSGKQIYHDIENLNIDSHSKILFRKALHIVALTNALHTGKQRVSYTNLSKNGKSRALTESFSNNNITGTIKLDTKKSHFKGSTLLP